MVGLIVGILLVLAILIGGYFLIRSFACEYKFYRTLSCVSKSDCRIYLTEGILRIIPFFVFGIGIGALLIYFALSDILIK